MFKGVERSGWNEPDSQDKVITEALPSNRFLNVPEVLELEILTAATAECHEDVGKKIFCWSGAFAVLGGECKDFFFQEPEHPHGSISVWVIKTGCTRKGLQIVLVSVIPNTFFELLGDSPGFLSQNTFAGCLLLYVLLREQSVPHHRGRIRCWERQLGRSVRTESQADWTGGGSVGQAAETSTL